MKRPDNCFQVICNNGVPEGAHGRSHFNSDNQLSFVSHVDDQCSEMESEGRRWF